MRYGAKEAYSTASQRKRTSRLVEWRRYSTIGFFHLKGTLRSTVTMVWPLDNGFLHSCLHYSMVRSARHKEEYQDIRRMEPTQSLSAERTKTWTLTMERHYTTPAVGLTRIPIPKITESQPQAPSV
ncbi:uncharacterized protein RCC_07111 [Ramularia collo-cygni]|uniref:Uncharacterized protein n=1 Tax=Ramularia collo-cygni TaxID=112498 RepID=A0A2D3V0E5_9PEZI|nr:uncharacterized protein RCC_07111 [Ramularia collo-cygni]CZT21248.1 uncharacterized protein RCC_07111 [Ramularia collo-cygni]